MPRRKPMGPIYYPENVTVYPAKDTGGRNRITWYDSDGKRRATHRVDLEQAKADAADLSARLAIIAGADTGTNFDRTFGELLDWYLSPDSRDGHWSVKHTSKQAGIVDKWIRPALGDRLCLTLTDQDMRAVLRRCSAAGNSREWSRAVGVTLRSIVSLGVRDGFLERDIMAGVKYAPRGTRRQGQSGVYVEPDSIPDQQAIDRAARHAAARTGAWWRALEVHLAAYSGLRWGEQHALTVDDINLDAGEIRVDRQLLADAGTRHLHRPKYEKVRVTFVADQLAPMLERRIAELHDTPPAPPLPCCPDGVRPGKGALLFPAPRGGYEEQTNWQARHWTAVRVAADWPTDPCRHGRQHNAALARRLERQAAERGEPLRVPPFDWRWDWHALRHHFCTWALATPPDGLGLEVADVAWFAGHATPDFTYRAYVSTRAGAVERARAASQAIAG